MKKIGIISCFGYKNWGDDAQLCNAILKLKKNNYKNILVFSRAGYIKELTKTPMVFSSHILFKNCKTNEQYLKKYQFLLQNYNQPNKLSINEKVFIKNLSKIDILWFSGSGAINTLKLSRLCIFFLPCILAKKLGKKVILTGQGVGNCDNKEYHPLMKEALNSIDIITVRDFDSGINQLKQLGITSSIYKGVDDAFNYPITTNKFKSLKNKQVLGINISFLITPKLKKILYNFAIIMKNQGYFPVFNYFQREEKIAKECSKGKFPVVGFNKVSEMAEFYNYCKIAIGMRYHSVIFALSQKVPTLNIYLNEYQANKIKAIEKELNIKMGVNCIKDTPTAKELVDLITNISSLCNQTKEVLISAHKQWTEKTNLIFNLLKGKYEK